MIKKNYQRMHLKKKGFCFLNSLMKHLLDQVRPRSQLNLSIPIETNNAIYKSGVVYLLELRLLHVKRPESQLDDLVSAGRERVEKTLDVVVVGVGKVWALKDARRLAKRARELDALAR
jgi:hypothetical protein